MYNVVQEYEKKEKMWMRKNQDFLQNLHQIVFEHQCNIILKFRAIFTRNVWKSLRNYCPTFVQIWLETLPKRNEDCRRNFKLLSSIPCSIHNGTLNSLSEQQLWRYCRFSISRSVEFFKFSFFILLHKSASQFFF